MLKDVVAVRALARCRLKLRFEDGVEGVVNVAELVPLTGVFAPLREPKIFCRVRVDPELGTVVWPGGADLDPDVLYSTVTGQPVPSLKKAGKKGRAGRPSPKRPTRALR